MIDRAKLLADLQRQVRSLEDDLRKRALADPALHAEWQQARTAERIAATFETWLDGRVTQAAVAWVLGTVFVRFCEDNRLIELPYLAGAGERLDVAKERQVEYFREHPDLTDRDWIIAGFDALSVSKVAAGLFNRQHNPLWTILPSHDAAKSLLGFWRELDLDEEGKVRHDFADPSWDTRFLGDLYQDLSEHARKTYALLQTPEFVEEFILDRTLEPAVDEFGLDGLRLIDPTCGSGHFLLGAFHRILGKWEKEAPGADRWDLIHRTLLSVHGVDKNPFAVAIARFRLMLAAMKAGDLSDLAKTPDFPLVIATGDSLLHGREAPNRQTDLFGEITFYFEWEDVDEYIKKYDILGMASYHVVVGNPPYITVRDKQEKDNYRESYSSCLGLFALSVPFCERSFRLAKRAQDRITHAGYTGQIIANSFMKREFGKKLIEEWLRTQVALTEIIDTSGAYIPGHGTPTVILVGRNKPPRVGETIRTVMGIRAEPSQPTNPSLGSVWSAIVEQIDDVGSESSWISVVDLDYVQLLKFPVSLGGGGKADLIHAIGAGKHERTGHRAVTIGRTAHTGCDEAYFAPTSTWMRFGINKRQVIPMSDGESIRNWVCQPTIESIFPYDQKLRASLTDQGSARALWLVSSHLIQRREAGGTHAEIGLSWYEWSRWHPERFEIDLGIAFAEVATHNHFALDRGGRVFNQTAPVIKLPPNSGRFAHLELLGVLNSSTACFWLKEHCFPKGGSGMGRGIQPEAWMERYAFNANNVHEFPLPPRFSLKLCDELDKLAARSNTVEPTEICTKTPIRESLDAARVEYNRLKGEMIALQEELDWEVYGLYGLIDEVELAELRVDIDRAPNLKLGERAFEIVLARKMAAGEIETQWFARHGSTPITEIPSHWSEEYQKVVAKRIEVIERRKDIALIERSECKRRWVTVPWEKKEKEALKNWLLDRCEARELWFTVDSNGREQPEQMTVNRLADRLRADADVVSVARLYAGRDADLADVLAEIVSEEHVPYLAALRYKDPGMRKRAQWERTWELQREEDATGERLDIPVPPKYSSADFRKTSYWRNRGKLDVPKERFISYPGAGPELDDSDLLGWAGWDHREQAHALMTLIDARGNDGWETEQMTPLIAGLAEVLPWVRQWHDDVDPEFGQSWADAYTGYLETQRLRYGVTDEHLADWRPAITRGRRKT